MIWEEVVKKYGRKMAEKIKESKCLDGITITLTDDGEEDIPEGDIVLAVRDIRGEKINAFEWD